METPDEIVKSVTRLVSLPEIYLRLQELVNKPDASLRDFASVVEKDPAITTRVLSIANSSFYGFPTKIDTVSRAVNIMGIAQLHDLILATSVMASFKGISADIVDMAAYWRRSILCGLVAKALAEKCRILDTERVFLEGLLHDIGHLVLYLARFDSAREVMETARAQSEPVYLIERLLLGFDYGELGAALMRAWKLPIGLQEAAAFHIEPSKAQHFPLSAAIVHLAWRIALTDETAEPTAPIPPVDSHALQLTGLKEENVDAVLPQSRQSLQETLSLFMPSSMRRLHSA